MVNFILQILSIGSLILSAATAQSSNVTTAATAANASVAQVPLGTRAVFGLGEQWMQLNSIYIGFLPDWSRETPIDINRALGKSVAIVGDYLDITETDLSLPQLKYHASDILRLRSLSIYSPAIRPRFTLDKWTPAMSQAVADACAQLNAQGVTVWLRFAWEMNGDWYEWGSDPTNFLTAWKAVTDAVRAKVNDRVKSKTYMLWSPNVRYGEVQSNAGYIPYYPGAAYVDLAGLSYYAPNNNGQVASRGTFAAGFDSFYRLYGQSQPIVIAETGAAMAYSVPTSLQESFCSDCEVIGKLPAVSSLSAVSSAQANDTAIKTTWLQQMVSAETAGRYPNLTAVNFFNHFKFGSTHNDAASSLMDYRATGANVETEAAFRQIVGNVSAYQGGFTGSASRTALLGSSAMMLMSLAVTQFVILS